MYDIVVQNLTKDYGFNRGYLILVFMLVEEKFTGF